MFIFEGFVNIILPLITNFGMQYVSEEFSIIFKTLFSNYYFKIIIFFCVFFSLTKNKYISFGLTVIVVVLFLTLYNKDSQYFILDEPFVTEVEILNAKKVLEKANSEREKKYDKKAAEFEKNVCNYGAV